MEAIALLRPIATRVPSANSSDTNPHGNRAILLPRCRCALVAIGPCSIDLPGEAGLEGFDWLVRLLLITQHSPRLWHDFRPTFATLPTWGASVGRPGERGNNNAPAVAAGAVWFARSWMFFFIYWFLMYFDSTDPLEHCLTRVFLFLSPINMRYIVFHVEFSHGDMISWHQNVGEKVVLINGKTRDQGW